MAENEGDKMEADEESKRQLVTEAQPDDKSPFDSNVQKAFNSFAKVRGAKPSGKIKICVLSTE